MTGPDEDAAAFLGRARRLLRPTPPAFTDRRSDLGGDHVLDPAWAASLEPGALRLAAVLVPVVLRPGAPATVLLTERAARLNRHSGQIAFPGGRTDPEDASAVETALREAEEEIGLDRAGVEPLGFLDAYLTGSNYFVSPLVAAIRPPLSLRLNPDEVASAFEVPLAFLMDEGSHELHAREAEDGVRQFYAMPFGSHYIWGMTAGILRNMFERLYGP